MSSEKTRAIVIRLVDFSESSYVATLFTEDFGKITGLAKGARRQKSAFENALDLLAVSRVVFLRKSSEGMDLLTEAKLERRFRASSRDLRRLYAGYYVAELLQILTDERDPHVELFRSALRAIEQLDGDGDVLEETLRFELAVLRELGHAPILDRCVECGTAINYNGRVAFGQLAGGALCGRCKVGQRYVVSLSSSAIRLMTRLLEEEPDNGPSFESSLVLPSADPTDANESIDTPESQAENLNDTENLKRPTQSAVVAVASRIATTGSRLPDAGETGRREPAEVPPSRAASGELRGLMNNVMSHRIGRRPRMFPFLAKLRG